MRSWLLLAFLSFVSWGLWAFFVKAASLQLSARTVLFYEIVGMMITGLFYLVFFNRGQAFQPAGVALAVAAGVMIMLGEFFFVYAVKDGSVSLVVVITALYPVLTIALAFLWLKESISLTEALGVLCALTAIVLFAV